MLPTSKDCLYGAAGSAISLPAGYGGMKASQRLLESWGICLSEKQTYFHHFDWFSKITDPLWRGVLKTISTVYIVVFIPLIEEWFFRGWIYQWQEADMKHKSEKMEKVFRVVSNAIIFGAFHLSFFIGWANVPILVVSTIAGVTFAALREITGNWKASAIAHALNNTVVLLTI